MSNRQASPRLSVNLNKIALVRNSRDTGIPSVVKAAVTVIEAGAQGITVHPRPDMRHVRPSDVHDLAELLAKPEYRDIEYNLEGNPFELESENGFPGFMKLVEDVRPHQCTLVPDSPGQLTSDHGWNLDAAFDRLKPIVDRLSSDQVRTSCFMDPILGQLDIAARLGADRIEFYTGPWAEHRGSARGDSLLTSFIEAGRHATSIGLGVNAGHDLNQENLADFCRGVSDVEEVSIGHAIIVDALWMGLSKTVSSYRRILDEL